MKTRLIYIQALHEEARTRGEKRYHPVPGDMWFASYLWDPEEDGHLKRTDQSFLSIEYARDHSTKRPPLIVVCPDGTQWTVDGTASNGKDGSGWSVTGEAPEITCTPSIKVSGYHGYLTNGVFTPDLDKR